MTPLGVALLAVILTCALSALFAASIAEQKQAAVNGFWLGLLFGPLGIIAAGFIDRRPNCPRCGGRINSICAKQYPICQHCGTELSGPTTDSSDREPASARSPVHSFFRLWLDDDFVRDKVLSKPEPPREA